MRVGATPDFSCLNPMLEVSRAPSKPQDWPALLRSAGSPQCTRWLLQLLGRTPCSRRADRSQSQGTCVVTPRFPPLWTPPNESLPLGGWGP